jgi:RNA polymerase-binding protein
MSDRVLRGARLGGQSFEDERGIEFAPRQQVAYICPKGHAFEIPMAEDAEVPPVWECARCGAEARLVDGAEPETKQEKPVRTHWDMLRERRSIPELEEILTERLTMLRAGEIGPVHLHRSSARTATARGTKAQGKAKSKPKAKPKAKNSA